MPRLTTRGLAGVEADDTNLSNVEGEIGRLSYRGYAIEDLIARPLEDVVYLLLAGELPDAGQAASFQQWFAEIGTLSAARKQMLARIGADADHTMNAVQALLPLLDHTGPDAPLPSLARFTEHAGLRLAVRLAPAVAQLIQPRAEAACDGDHCIRFLTSVLGRRPSAIEQRAFATVQILQLDHGFNAGTFTARVVASTRASTPAALSAAAGALSGVLHGGADAAALADAREVAHPARAAAFVDACLDSGRRVMGMGHREYRVVDPRARIVKMLAAEVVQGKPELTQLFETLVAMEECFAERMKARGKALHANLEFYKSIPYLACGIPEAAFTATFASARAFGWVAHIAEARSNGTIIRPAARWAGSGPRAMVA